MNTNWKSYLQQLNASFSENGDTVFADDPQTSETTPGRCQKMDLSYLGIIRITGDDKLTFLQGQLTNDMRNINNQQSQLGSYCTPKGRMLASFRLFGQDDSWYMVLPRPRLEAILKRLRMFVLMSKVSLEDVSDKFICCGFSGACVAQDLTIDLPLIADEVKHAEGISFIRVDAQHPRYLAIGQFEDMHDTWQKLDNAVPASTAFWRLYDIRSGIPTVYEETVEAFIPQMTNLQLLNGVSFTKGCYTGQEIVARMQYLGKLKRRMYPVTFNSTATPHSGDEIYSDTSQSGQGAGKLVDVVRVGDQQYEALAVIEIKNLEEGRLKLVDENGPVLQIIDPPYSFETGEP